MSISTQEYTARITRSAVTLTTNNYGRDGNHAMGACPVCLTHVCLTHHTCQGRGMMPI